MNEPAHLRARGGRQHRLRSGDVAEGEAGAVGRADDAGDVDHRVGPLDQPGQCVGPVKRPLHPGDAIAQRLGPAGEGAHPVTGGERAVDDVAADEAGAAGDRQHGHTSAR